MSVNTMSFMDASTFLNDLKKEITGQESIAPLNESEFVSVATTLKQIGLDPLINSITQMVSRTIYSRRPYVRRFKGLQVDNQRYGAIVRKLSPVDKPLETDVRFMLEEGSHAPADMFKVNKPEVLQANFYGANTFKKSYTIFRDQFDNAFDSSAAVGEFVNMVVGNVADILEQNHENISKAILSNLIAGKVAANNSVIHLLTEYNTATGQQFTATTIRQPANYGPFIKWVYGRIANLTRMMAERSVKFQINVNGKPVNRHTPLQDMRVYISAEYMDMMDARVLADTYHDNFLKLADTEAIASWQSIDSPDQIIATPSYLDSATGNIITPQEPVTVNNIFGVLFDRDAAGYTMMNEWSGTTPLEVDGGYWNTIYHQTSRWWNDFTEKAIVLLMD